MDVGRRRYASRRQFELHLDALAVRLGGWAPHDVDTAVRHHEAFTCRGHRGAPESRLDDCTLMGRIAQTGAVPSRVLCEARASTAATRTLACAWKQRQRDRCSARIRAMRGRGADHGELFDHQTPGIRRLVCAW